MLKRSGFSKPTLEKLIASRSKPRKALKPSKLALSGAIPKKRVKGTTKKKTGPLKTKLWELCKQITRLRYGNTCYTCGKTGLAGGSWHTGHFIPSSVGGHSLRYSLGNLRPQCYRCNIDLSGNGSQFYKNLVERESQEYVDGLFDMKNKLVKADEIWFQGKIDEYSELFRSMK